MLDIEQHDRVRLLRLNRPEALNAFDTPLYRATAEALDAAGDDPSVAAVVLTGAGRAFSAGQDLAEMATLSAGAPRAEGGAAPDASTVSGFPAFAEALERFPKPLLAAVNGVGVGVGFTMLAFCDLVLIAESARLRAPFTALGVAPEAASSYLFPLRMGWQRAAWVLFSGSWVEAAEAVELGIAWKACPDDEVLDATLATAGALARWPIPSLVATKQAMTDAHRGPITRAREVEDAAFARLVGTPANLEAVTAFLEKRSPDFSGIPGA
jgi:enoyl-CoA hydratase/carnithine racemase